MISEYLSYLVVGVVSFTAGAIIQFGALKVRGRKVVVPFIESSSRNLTLLAIGLGLMSLFTIVQVDQNANQYRECQIEFQTALAYNSDITAQERPLDLRRAAAETEADQALSEFVHLLLQPGVDVRANLQLLDQRRFAANEKINQVEEERQILTAARAPYPAPRCGA